MATYSGNLPPQLQQEASQWVASRGVELDEFIAWAVAEKIADLKHHSHDPDFPSIGYGQGASGQITAVVNDRGIRVQTIAIAANQWGVSTAQIAIKPDFRRAGVSPAQPGQAGYLSHKILNTPQKPGFLDATMLQPSPVAARRVSPGWGVFSAGVVTNSNTLPRSLNILFSISCRYSAATWEARK